MSLRRELEEQGGVLFRYRGQIPVLLFLLAVPFILLTPYEVISDDIELLVKVAAVALSVLGFWVRAVSIGTTPKGTSGRNTEKQVADTLNQTGIYSMVRHPLYLGNYLIWIGIVVYTINIYFVLLVTLAFWLYYERIMFTEERFLEGKFGDRFLDWAGKTPAFFPAFGNYIKSNIPFSFKTVLRREYSGFLATVIGFLFVDIIRDYSTMHKFELNFAYICVLSVALIITLILRSLKHHSAVLNEADRS